MDNARKYGVACVILCLLLLLEVSFPLPGETQGESEDAVFLDADKVVFEEETGLAVAEGNVRVRRDVLRVFAHRVEMDSTEQVMSATSEPGKKVTLIQGDRVLTGDSLRYNMLSREGILTGAVGSSPAGDGRVFLRGKQMEVAPVDVARSKGWISSKGSKGVEEDELIGKLSDVSLTTCNERSPHYRLVSKSVVFVPGKRIIAKNPKVYIGEHLLFSYPFDYVVPLDPKERRALLSSFFPLILSDSDKGQGVGIGGPYVWDTGKALLNVAWWSDTGWEGKATVEQRLNDYWTVWATVEHSYEKESAEKLYRPSWGILHAANGWNASLRWTQREAISIQKKVGETYRGVLWREPEFSLLGPWGRAPLLNAYGRIGVSWGEYEDVQPAVSMNVRRLGAEVQLYSEEQLESYKTFVKSEYKRFWYDDPDSLEQEIFDSVFGIRYAWGTVDLSTAYVRRWVSGETPMLWEYYRDREDLYQQVVFPAGKNLSFRIRGGYDLIDSKLAEMVYSVTLKGGECSRWELTYRNDRAEGDDWVGLSFFITAFPDTPVSFGRRELYDPFALPDGLAEVLRRDEEEQ